MSTQTPQIRTDQAARAATGRFARGVSGNPGGRPRIVADVQALARQHSASAIAVLAEVMTDEDQPAVARVAAAKAMLDRGYGTPQSSLTITTSDTGEQLKAARDLFERYIAENSQPMLARYMKVEVVAEGKLADPSFQEY